MTVTTLKALSLKPLWACLMVLQEKTIETRKYRYSDLDTWVGDKPIFVAVHASKTWDRQQAELMNTEPFLSRLAVHGITSGNATHATMPRGSLVGVGRIVAVTTTDTLEPGNIGVKETMFGDYSANRWLYHFDRVWPVWANEQRFMASGRLGVWELTPEQTRTLLVGIQHHDDLPAELTSESLVDEAAALLTDRAATERDLKWIRDQVEGRKSKPGSVIERMIDKACRS